MRNANVRRALAGAALVAAAVGPTAWAAGPVERLHEVAEALRSRPVWRADYVQAYIPAGLSGGEEVVGTVRLAWPDRALFTTGDPVVRRMGLDGRRVRLVDLEVSSCEDHRLTDDEWARVPLVALLDPDGAVDRFILASDGDRLTLTPREPGGVQQVTVTVGDDGLPAEVAVHETGGSVNRFTLSGWRAGRAPEGGWLPRPPAGVECRETGSPGAGGG